MSGGFYKVSELPWFRLYLFELLLQFTKWEYKYFKSLHLLFKKCVFLIYFLSLDRFFDFFLLNLYKFVASSPFRFLCLRVSLHLHILKNMCLNILSSDGRCWYWLGVLDQRIYHGRSRYFSHLLISFWI